MAALLSKISITLTLTQLLDFAIDSFDLFNSVFEVFLQHSSYFLSSFFFQLHCRFSKPS